MSMSPLVTMEDVGRLPAPELALEPEAFAVLARVWRDRGFWLTAWRSDRDEPMLPDAPSPFWEMLWTKGRDFAGRLSNAARSYLAGCSNGRIPAEGLSLPSMWRPSLNGVALPLRIGRRNSGILLALSLSHAESHESFAKLCGDLELDAAAMGRLAREVPGPRGGDLEPVLQLCADQAIENQTLRREVAALTHNLECTYEELHLIYNVSGKMSLAQRPARILAAVAHEVKQVCRASAIAFILKEGEASLLRGAASGVPEPSLADRVVQVGVGAPGLAELDRLAECLPVESNSNSGHLLLNRANARPECAWAAPWLRHVVALPLWYERNLLGVMLAINCEDGGDFTSVDVQLFRAIADRVAPFLENRRLYDDLGDLLMGMLHALVNSIDAKDTYTCGHSERVAYLSRVLAEAAGLPEALCERIYLAGLLHDVGKIGVPDAILTKCGKLTNEEFDAMRRHPEIGARILSRVNQVQDLLPGVLHHHERMDGRGYPDGLTGDEIPLMGKIICIADCFDAMTTNRTYRAALPTPVALAEVRRCAGTQFDPHLSEVFLRLDHVAIMTQARGLSTHQAPPDTIDVTPRRS